MNCRRSYWQSGERKPKKYPPKKCTKKTPKHNPKIKPKINLKYTTQNLQTQKAVKESQSQIYGKINIKYMASKSQVFGFNQTKLGFSKFPLSNWGYSQLNRVFDKKSNASK
jgi:hypothetical protein